MQLGYLDFLYCFWMVTRQLVFKLVDSFNRFWLRKANLPPYNHIVQLGDPVLRCKCKSVDKSYLQDPEFKKLLGNMRKAVKRYKCAGISAPQLGVNLRVIALWFPKQEDHHSTIKEYEMKEMRSYPYTVWINPTLKVIEYKKISFLEGCESMRGFSAEVPRYSKVQLTGWDENGQERSEQLSGWLARVAQHETDHLNGRLFLDQAPLSSLTCSFWDRVNATGGHIHMSYYPNKFFSRA